MKMKIGKSRNAAHFRMKAGEVGIGQVQCSRTGRTGWDGIEPRFLRKMEALGLIRILQQIPGEVCWQKLAEIPAE